eukprot:SAG31_NODE_6348_length_2052_cov_5.239424_4_plen_64_part_00
MPLSDYKQSYFAPHVPKSVRATTLQAPLLVQEYVKPLHDIRYAVEWHREDRIARVNYNCQLEC